MATLKEKTAKGLFWGGMNNGVQQLIGLIFGIILGRLLAPADYGMMAMIQVFSLVATALQSSGFVTAIANLKQPRDEDYNSVFWFNILMGSFLYLVLFFCAPLIASYYHTPKLISLCRYAFLSIIIASASTSQSAFLFKNLMAKQQAKAGMTAVILSSIAGSLMAFCGMAYWSLATQGLVFVLINTLLFWHYSPWRPTLHIDLHPAFHMFKFSCKILATTICTIINNNVMNLLLGHYFTLRDTGNYNQAYQWNFKCFSLVQGMVNQVAQPVLVDLQDEQGRQINAFRKMVRFTAFITFPLLFGFGLVAKEFIVLAIGQKWLVSAGYIQLLCISGAVIPLCTLLSNLIISKGRSGTYFWCTFVLGLCQIILMIVLWPLGIYAMVIAYVLLNTAWLFVWFIFARRLSGYRLLHFLKDILPFALAAFGVMLVTGLLTSILTNLWLLLFSRIILAAGLYFIVMKLARVQILNECIAFLSHKL